MTSFPLPASSKRLPLPYIAALAGLVAATSATLVLVAGTSGREEWVTWTFPIACALAVTVAIVLGLPLHALLRVSGLTGRWVYVAATFIIVGGPYLWLLGPAWLRVDTRTAIETSLLVPAAALPGGLLFHHLAHRARSVPPFELRDAFIIATWVAALLFLVVTPYSIPVHVDDHRGRILQAAHHYGLAAFMLLGILAGLARLWSWRISLFVVAVAWFIPIAFAAMWYFRTPVGLYAIE